MDGIGWHGEVLRTLGEPHGLCVEVYVLLRTALAEAGYFYPGQFTLGTCHGRVALSWGYQTTSKARSANDTGWKFTFGARVCAVRCRPSVWRPYPNTRSAESSKTMIRPSKCGSAIGHDRGLCVGAVEAPWLERKLAGMACNQWRPSHQIP
jgi:hypothetical protein